ncbi:MAG: hypothetical protein JW384_03306 [Nitrosomonadaceae bacterium]|nr:hypothetical protein [Nitrosomonadaceae bacterium]
MQHRKADQETCEKPLEEPAQDDTQRKKICLTNNDDNDPLNFTKSLQTPTPSP